MISVSTSSVAFSFRFQAIPAFGDVIRQTCLIGIFISTFLTIYAILVF